MTTRRRFGKWCVGALLSGRRLLSAGDNRPLTWSAQPAPTAGSDRRYRVGAQVILLGIPVLHRANVGDGTASWLEALADDGATIRMLEFTGRSAPERAAGLNRFGFIQELSRGDASREAIYFGLMTSSPEESAADARKALHSDAKESWYSAIDGRISADGVETAAVHFLAPARTSTAQRQELIAKARQGLAEAPRTHSESHGAAPFLHALAGLLKGPAKRTEYSYNGRTYTLTAEKSVDPKAAREFRGQGQLGPSAAAIRVDGSLRRKEGGKSTEFRLWIEEGAARPLPLRIEYQPKSYLRLTFEAEG